MRPKLPVKLKVSREPYARRFPAFGDCSKIRGCTRSRFWDLGVQSNRNQYFTIAVNESGLRLAPPTKAPSISSSPISAVALSGLTLPP